MIPLHWLYEQALGHETPGDARCYLCGCACTGRNPVAKAIADTFNSHWRAMCRSSEYLCDACAWYLDNKAGHEDYRKMSLVVMPHSWRNWQRTNMKADIERWLADGLEEDAYLVVSLTKKKHILLQAPLNVRGAITLAIQVEEQVAYVDNGTWQQIGIPFMRLLALGHNKGEVLSGDLYANTLRKHGRLAEAMRLSNQLDPWRDSALIELYSYVTVLEEKEEKQDDGPGGGDTTDRAGPGDATDRHGIPVVTGGLEKHRPGVQESVPGRNLEAVRGAHSSGKSDDGQPASVSQSSLWDATGS